MPRSIVSWAACYRRPHKRRDIAGIFDGIANVDAYPEFNTPFGAIAVLRAVIRC